MYERYDPIDKISKQYWPMGDGSITMQNPYWANYRNLRENRKDRYMLNAVLSYDILDWLNVSGRIRIDNSHNTYTEKMYASSNVQLTEQSANGLYARFMVMLCSISIKRSVTTGRCRPTSVLRSRI